VQLWDHSDLVFGFLNLVFRWLVLRTSRALWQGFAIVWHGFAIVWQGFAILWRVLAIGKTRGRRVATLQMMLMLEQTEGRRLCEPALRRAEAAKDLVSAAGTEFPPLPFG